MSIRHPTTSLNPVVRRNPTNEPRADLSALSPVPSAARYSPINAPANGPIIIPNGGKTNNQAIIPIVDPVTPALVPPYFFVHQIGR